MIIGINNTKFLGLELDKNVSWKNHVQKILPKLSSTWLEKCIHVVNQILSK
jgi:hypothetical protein